MSLISLIISLIFYGLLAGLSALFLVILVVYIITERQPVIERREVEKSYYDPVSKKKMKFPYLEDKYEVNLSVVVPAYNEELRPLLAVSRYVGCSDPVTKFYFLVPPMLDEATEFLEKRVKENPGYKYEIIVVSDGSKDNTVKVAQTYTEKYGSDKVRCLELVENRGKGGAVKMGIQNARGATILFADADGASKFQDLTKLESSLANTVKHDPLRQPDTVSHAKAIVIGSRAHLEEESLANRSIFRNLLMFGFHFLVWLFTVRGIRDTQCGFKLFTRKAAVICFQSLHVTRWAFDVELLYIAQKLNIPISEIPVRWTEIEGSKITPVLSWIQMGLDLCLIWLRYKTGIWKVHTEKND